MEHIASLDRRPSRRRSQAACQQGVQALSQDPLVRGSHIDWQQQPRPIEIGYHGQALLVYPSESAVLLDAALEAMARLDRKLRSERIDEGLSFVVAAPDGKRAPGSVPGMATGSSDPPRGNARRCTSQASWSRPRCPTRTRRPRTSPASTGRSPLRGDDYVGRLERVPELPCRSRAVEIERGRVQARPLRESELVLAHRYR